MKRSLGTIVAGLCLLLGAVCFAAGCSTGQAGLLDTGRIQLESHAPGKVYVAWSDAREVDGGFVVTGVLRRNDVVGPPIRASVAAEIVSPCGSILDTAKSDSLCVPHRRVNRVQGFERFSVRFATIPPEGSRVRLVVHSS